MKNSIAPKLGTPHADLHSALRTELRALIANSRQRLAGAVNAELTRLYWAVGERLRTEVLGGADCAQYGAKLLDQLGAQLAQEFGRGFESRNLRRMVRFADAFPDLAIVSTLSTQLSWSHLVAIVALKSPDARQHYAQQAGQQAWSVRELHHQIERKAFERGAIASTQAPTLQTEGAEPEVVFKDPYFLDFLGLRQGHDEGDLEAAILRQLEAFVLELGRGLPFGKVCKSHLRNALAGQAVMKQISLATTGFKLATKVTRKRELLTQIGADTPWSEFLALIAPHALASKNGRPSFTLEVMLRIHLLQQLFGHSDPTVEECLHDVPLYRELAHLDTGLTRIPDESIILRFGHLLEAHSFAPQILNCVNAKLAAYGLLLKAGMVVDATLIAAPSSTKNSTGERDPEMHQTKKGNQWHFGMKAHIGEDAYSGLVHTVIGTTANLNDVTQGHGLLHGNESVVFADAGYQGAAKRVEAIGMEWHVVMRPGKRRALGKQWSWGSLLDKAEQLKASVRAKVEHPFRVIKCQFGFTKVRYKGLAKNTAQLVTLFALSNLWIARKRIIQGAPG